MCLTVVISPVDQLLIVVDRPRYSDGSHSVAINVGGFKGISLK